MLRWLKPVIFLACLAPLANLVWRGFHAQLGANPIEAITHRTGDCTLTFLLITLSVTPLRKLTRQYWLIGFRRMLGLFAFFYGTLHLMTYVWLDKFFDVHEMLADIAKRRFITAGMTAFAPDDSAGPDLDQMVDPKIGRQTLAGPAPPDLFQRRCRSDPLHLAGKSRPEEAAGVRRCIITIAALSADCVDRIAPTGASKNKYLRKPNCVAPAPRRLSSGRPRPLLRQNGDPVILPKLTGRGRQKFNGRALFAHPGPAAISASVELREA